VSELADGAHTDASPPDDDHGGHRFNRAIRWNAISKVATRAMQFFVTVALARLLLPADFGLYGMTSIVTGLVSMFAEFGFAYALIQKLSITDEDISTALSMSVLLGTFVTIACLATAPLIAMVFRNPAVTLPLRAASLGMFIVAFAITPRALLGRRMDFRSIAYADMIGSITYAVVSVGLAAARMGIWALVFGGLAMAFAQAIILWIRADYRFRPALHRESLRALMPFGTRMFASNIVDFLRGNLDYFVLGRGLGPVALGMYTIAFKTADFPRQRMASIIGDVALPAMSSVQEHDDMLRHTYRRTVLMTGLVTFPLLLGVTVIAPQFVSAVYGSKWLGAVGALRVLLPMGVMLAVAESGSNILIAKGRPEVFLRLSVLYAVCVGLFASIGLSGGILGVALGVLAATFTYFVAFQISLWRCLRIGPAQTFGALVAPTLACLVMVIVLVVYDHAVAFPAGSFAALAWLAGAGVLAAAAYAPIAWPLYRRALKDRAHDSAEEPECDTQRSAAPAEQVLID
jgi:O-antigen/teichoic acid export membrane protein